MININNCSMILPRKKRDTMNTVKDLILMDDIERKLSLDKPEDYYLEYRDTLGFDDRITFGFEIEFEHMDYDVVNRWFEKTLPRGWHVKTDETLNNGGEITTGILTDNTVDWYSVKRTCERIREIAKVGINTGSHIHIGTQALGDNYSSWLNFIKLWSVYENIIYRFCYGEYLNARPNITETAFPLADIYWDSAIRYKNLSNYKSLIKKLNISRYTAVNVKRSSDGTKENKYNTIEFRCPNGTLNEVVWQNNLNLIIHLINYAKSNNFDDYKVEKRKYLNRNIKYNIDYYNEIDIDMAIELSNMIFDKEIDKLYFLRQYFKSFEVCNDKRIYKRAKNFTK